MAEARFSVGQRVRVADRTPAVHHRVPGYAKGRVGIVERVCAEHGRPETFIRGDGKPATRLYRVRFLQRELWAGYGGMPSDCLDVEVFEHWLENAE